MKKDTSWGGVADWYDETIEGDEDSYQSQVLLPNILRLFDLKANPAQSRTFLDVACGQGFFAREIAKEAPLSRVIGCDISHELIGIAKVRQTEDAAKTQAANAKPIEYHVSAATDLSFAGDASVDRILISLALQNIEDVPGVFMECARVLKPDGKIVFILNHPAFRIPKRSSWGWDAEAKPPRQYRRVDSYMSEMAAEIDMAPGDEGKELTVSFHRPLQYFVKSLVKSGLSVTRLEEWISHKRSKPGARASEENRMKKEIPMFMMIEAGKMN